MSTKEENIFTIGIRFREERDKLEFSQATLATRICTSDRTIKNYESGASSPKANELARFAALGADVQYIVTGERSETLGVREKEAEYLPAEQLANAVRSLNLHEEDAALLEQLARRVAAPRR